MTPGRATLPALTAAVLMLAACGGGGDEPEGLETSAAPVTETAEPTPTEDPEAEAVAAIEARYHAYWDAVVASEYGHDGVANVRRLVDTEVTRDGEFESPWVDGPLPVAEVAAIVIE